MGSCCRGAEWEADGFGGMGGIVRTRRSGRNRPHSAFTAKAKGRPAAGQGYPRTNTGTRLKAGVPLAGSTTACISTLASG